MANKKNATNTKNSEKVHDQYGILKRAEYKQINIRLGENMSNFKEITVKEIELKNCTRYYYSIDLNNADEDLISSLYFKVISEIREKKLQVVFEKIYGKIEYKPKHRKDS